MHNLLSSKGQFFIVAAVGIVIILLAMSRIMAPYTIQDLSKPITGEEAYFFNNVNEKLMKTIEMSVESCPPPIELEHNLAEYVNFTKKIAAEKGFKLRIDYEITDCSVYGIITLMSERIKMTDTFSYPE